MRKFSLLFFGLFLACIREEPVAEKRGGLTPEVETPAVTFGKSYAVVAGIDSYSSPWQKLKYAVGDAKAVAAALKKQGFEVIEL